MKKKTQKIDEIALFKQSRKQAKEPNPNFSQVPPPNHYGNPIGMPGNSNYILQSPLNPMALYMQRFTIKDRIKDANMKLKLAINKKNIITGKYKMKNEIHDLDSEEKGFDPLKKSKSKKKSKNTLKSMKSEELSTSCFPLCK